MDKQDVRHIVSTVLILGAMAFHFLGLDGRLAVYQQPITEFEQAFCAEVMGDESDM